MNIIEAKNSKKSKTCSYMGVRGQKIRSSTHSTLLIETQFTAQGYVADFQLDYFMGILNECFP